MAAADSADSADSAEQGQRVATAAEVLYLVNLLLLPGLGFLILLWLWWRERANNASLATSHLAQTVSASLWAGVLLVIANAAVIVMGGYHGAHAWVVAIMWFTVFHSTLVLLGVFGLSKAMAGQCWRFPLIGRPLPSGCSRPGAGSR